MVKTKGGRLMNPTDAFRKEQRKKEIQRNKLERKYQREAHRRINEPDELKQELQRVLEAEKEGMLNKTLRLKKKVLQEAYDQALKRKKEEELRRKRVDVSETAAPGGSHANPEESRYYHPTLNPTGAPPPGKVNAFQCPVPSTIPGSMRSPTKASLPIPPPPPLPPGPAPSSLGIAALPPPPAAPPLPPGPAPQMLQGQSQPLPPPTTPPPGYGEGLREDVDVLPPPPGPPPGFSGTEQDDSDSDDEAPPGVEQHMVVPPPTAPPPMNVFQVPVPQGPPPGHPQGLGRLPVPPVPPPGYSHPNGQGPSGVPLPLMPSPMSMANAGKRETKSTITGVSTVVKRPLAHNDRALTSMVPASVRIKRESLKPKPKVSLRKPDIAPGFGLMPSASTSVAPVPQRKPLGISGNGPSMEQKIMDFFEEVKELGAFDEME